MNDLSDSGVVGAAYSIRIFIRLLHVSKHRKSNKHTVSRFHVCRHLRDMITSSTVMSQQAGRVYAFTWICKVPLMLDLVLLLAQIVLLARICYEARRVCKSVWSAWSPDVSERWHRIRYACKQDVIGIVEFKLEMIAFT